MEHLLYFTLSQQYALFAATLAFDSLEDLDAASRHLGSLFHALCSNANDLGSRLAVTGITIVGASRLLRVRLLEILVALSFGVRSWRRAILYRYQARVCVEPSGRSAVLALDSSTIAPVQCADHTKEYIPVEPGAQRWLSQSLVAHARRVCGRNRVNSVVLTQNWWPPTFG
jgi:hypothetical protein